MEERAVGLPALAKLDERGAVLVGAIGRVDSSPAQQNIVDSLNHENVTKIASEAA